MSLWKTISSVFAPKNERLEDGSFLSSFRIAAKDLDPYWIQYVGDCIETGKLSKGSDGYEWFFVKSSVEVMPESMKRLAEQPLLHAWTECGIPLLCSTSMPGCVTFHFKTALKSLNTVKLATVVVPPSTTDDDELFYWGVAPNNPAFARKRFAEILAALQSIPHVAWGPADSARSYFSGDPKPLHALYVATFHEGTSAIAFPQYFLDDNPTDSEPVLLADGEHTVLEGTVPLIRLSSHIS